MFYYTQKVTTRPPSRALREISMGWHGARLQEIPRCARDDVVSEQLPQKLILFRSDDACTTASD